MSTNNHVFQIIPTKGNLAPLTAGSTLDDLAIGQIGVFDDKTGLAIDGTSKVNDIFLAVGVDSDGDTVKDSIVTSAGQKIQLVNTRAYTFRAHTAAAPMIFELSDYKARCETDYALKIEFRNQEIYRGQGYNQFTHTYSVRTACCDSCESCEIEDCNELGKLLLEAINADPKGLVIAEPIDPVLNTVIPDVDAFIATHKDVNTDDDPDNDVCMKIRVTSVPIAINKYCSINLKHYHPRQTVLIPSLQEGFYCAGTLTTTQQPAFEEGAGYDLQQKEYQAGGWNGKSGPYRLQTNTGTAKAEIEYLVDKTITYDQFMIAYDQFSVAGWGEHLNNLATIIAVPETDTITSAGLATILDLLLNPLGFDNLTDDVAIADVDPTVVEKTEDATPATDGIA